MTTPKIQPIDFDESDMRKRLGLRLVSADKLADAMLAAFAAGKCDFLFADETDGDQTDVALSNVEEPADRS